MRMTCRVLAVLFGLQSPQFAIASVRYAVSDLHSLLQKGQQHAKNYVSSGFTCGEEQQKCGAGTGEEHKQASSLARMLTEIEKASVVHNLQYFVTSGTLLGSLRSQSFIKGDDDADIVVTQESYVKMYELLTSGRLGIDETKTAISMLDPNLIPSVDQMYNDNCAYGRLPMRFIDRGANSTSACNYLVDVFLLREENNPHGFTWGHEKHAVRPEQRFQMNQLFPVKKGTFEGVTISLPADPEGMATYIYGNDYMVPRKKGPWGAKKTFTTSGQQGQHQQQAMLNSTMNSNQDDFYEWD